MCSDFSIGIAHNTILRLLSIALEVSAVVSEGNAAGGFIGSNGDADDDASLTVESGVSTVGQ